MKWILACCVIWFANHAAAEPPERLVTVGGAMTEIVYALGAHGMLVGSDTSSYYPKEAEALPKVGYQRALSAEGILSLQPDMVILTDEAGPPPVLKQLKAAGVTLLMLPASRNVHDTKAHIRAIGHALGRDSEASARIAAIEKAHTALNALLEANPTQKKLMFVLQHGGGAPMVAGSDTAADAIMTLAGGDNVVDSYAGYKPLTPESAVALNPDIILITHEGLAQAGGKKGLLKTPGLALTNAGKTGNIIAMDALFLLGFGPRTIEAATALHRALHAL